MPAEDHGNCQAGAEDAVPTGVAGLDQVLGGGLQKGRLHLVQGTPGAGKMTPALQFLLAGAAAGESGLQISLSETEEEIRAAAASHGWSLDGIHIHDASAVELANLVFQQSVFQPAEVELTETTRKLLAAVEQIKPARVVFDPITELRLLAGRSDALPSSGSGTEARAFAAHGSTVLLIEDRVDPQHSAASLVHSIIELEQVTYGFGRDRRRLRVQKVRGRSFREDYHDLAITRGGLCVYPTLVATERERSFVARQLASGIPALDRLLGGGGWTRAPARF